MIKQLYRGLLGKPAKPFRFFPSLSALSVADWRCIFGGAGSRALRPCALILILLSASLALSADAPLRDLTLADPVLTPGVVRKLSLRTICNTRWGTDRRFVTAAMKREVFRRYGLIGNDDPACVPDTHGRRCEIDHLAPRSLAGADDINNLSPQPFGTHPWNAARKDRIELKLGREVCAGNITLKQAQDEIMTDYRIPYIRYFGHP